MYPKSNDSIKGYIIEVTIEKNKELYGLKTWAGKTKKVDCNKHIILGKLIKKEFEDGDILIMNSQQTDFK